MANLNLKRTVLYIALGTSWALGNVSAVAAPFDTSSFPDPEVLVSQTKPSDNGPKQNMESTLVDIKAVDAPTLHSENGKIGIASEVRNGQGIILDSEGVIATNRHIIGNAQHIFVVLSGGKTFEANVLRNSQADLCLIKINAPFPLRAISLADPSEIQTGSKVTAIANAGLNPQRVMGGQIIKIFTGKFSSDAELLEMDITLKPGDSGGPILNEEGSLLGLIMGKQISDPSKSYAIASNRIQQEYFKYRNSILN